MDKGAFRIGTIYGIPIRIHFTFLLALPLIAFGFGRAFMAAAAFADVPPEQLRGSPWLWGLGLAIALFLSVLLHELAHSLYALRVGGKVRDITLLMIGGVSQIVEPPRRAKQEAVMALVGPLVSLALSAVLYAAHALCDRASFSLRFGLFYLAGLNFFLGLFNLLPAFPMDGGRILRALLATRLGTLRATQIAARIGKGFAVLFALWGFTSFNMLLVLVAFFIFLGADAEAKSVTAKTLLGRVHVQDIMHAEVHAVPAHISVHEAAERMLAERQLAYALTEQGESAGVLTLEAVQAVSPLLRKRTLARDIALKTPSLSPAEEAVRALNIMSETGAPELAVTERGQVVGTVSRDDIVRELKLNELETSQRDAQHLHLVRQV